MTKITVFPLSIILLLLIFSSSIVATASSAESESAVIETECLDDGSYFVTIVQTLSSAKAASTRTGSKTVYYNNSAGETMWSITVTATFSYQSGSSCSCTTVSGSSVSYNSSWTVTSATTSKSANKASASATGRHYSGSTLVESISKTVTLTCDTYGNLS